MTDTISENRTRHAREVEQIRTNADLSAEAKRRKMAEAHERAMAEHRKLIEEGRRARAQELAAAERKVLGIPYPERSTASEQAIIAMSYRDALSRAEIAANSRENTGALQALLERAEASGDDLLGVAVYHTATRRGLRQVADRYLEERPKERSRWERYVAARQEADSAGGLLRTTVTEVPPSRPPELR